MDGKLSGWRVAVNTFAVVVLVFLVLPSVIVMVISFGDSSQIVFPPSGFSLALFKRLWTDEGWVSSAWLSLQVALSSTAISVLLGVPAAYALSRGRFPGRRVLALFLLSPIMVPHVVIALALYVYFVEIGLTHGGLRLALAHSVATLPFVIITASTGLKHIDPSLERVATIMGAGRLTVLRKVTLPLLTPSIVSGALFAFLISFDEVVISWFVARAGYTTLPVKMFSSIQFEVSPVLAAVSTLLTVLSIAICVFVARLQRGTPS